jgi:hypothetical protein
MMIRNYNFACISKLLHIIIPSISIRKKITGLVYFPHNYDAVHDLGEATKTKFSHLE